MWRIGYSETFARTCRKLLRRNRVLGAAFASAVSLLEQDPRHPHLKLHALHGELDGLWAVRVTYSVRLVLTLDDTRQEIILIDIGSHDEAYR